jgi:hypothetical protein
LSDKSDVVGPVDRLMAEISGAVFVSVFIVLGFAAVVLGALDCFDRWGLRGSNRERGNA